MNDLINVFDHTLKAFASAFSGTSDEQSGTASKADYAVRECHLDPGATRTTIPGRRGEQSANKHGTFSRVSSGGSSDSSSRNSEHDMDSISIPASPIVQNLSVVDAESGAREKKFQRCYDEVCLLKRHLKHLKQQKNLSHREVNAIERRISIRIGAMNQIEESLSQEKARDGLCSNSGMVQLPQTLLVKDKPGKTRSKSSSPVRVSWHASVSP
jgi:hypothetical protein